MKNNKGKSVKNLLLSLITLGHEKSGKWIEIHDILFAYSKYKALNEPVLF